MPWKCFCFDFALVQDVATLCLHWPLAPLFPTPWTGCMSQWSVYLSYMSMVTPINFDNPLDISLATHYLMVTIVTTLSGNQKGLKEAFPYPH